MRLWIFTLVLALSACQWLKHAPDAAYADAPSITIDASTGRPISPFIFGFGSYAEKDRTQAGVWSQMPSLYRFGGNTAERFNWKINAYNAAKDYFFLNTTLDTPNAVDAFIDENKQHRIASAVVLPLIGWVAKDGTSASFPVAEFPDQQQVEANGKGIGNGLAKDGTPLKADPATTSIQAGPSFIAEWVTHLRDRFGAYPHFYILGNEPMLWGDTHRDIHPDPTTYDEYLAKFLAAAQAVRQADPAAIIIGPAEWGWLSIGQSESDKDREQHGGAPFLEWFLTAVRQQEATLNLSLLDVLDYHYYPSNLALYNDGPYDSANRRLRLDSTRSLWDPTYNEGGWINQAVNFIPQLKDIIQRTKPGLKLAIGEYNFKGEADIGGAIALAEVLRVLVDQDVYLAEYWSDPPSGSPAAAAFRLFRNYDGNGAAFGDTLLSHDHAAHDDLTLIASRGDFARRITVVVINKSVDADKQVTIGIDHLDADIKTVKSYTLSSADPSHLRPDTLPTGMQASLKLPPLSAMLVEFAY